MDEEFSRGRPGWKWSARGRVFRGKTCREIASVCAAAGFHGVELDNTMFEGASAAELAEARKEFESMNLKAATFHLPSDINNDISSFYESVRKKALRNTLAWMERAAILGADTGVLHPTTSRLDTSPEEEQSYLGSLGRSLAELLPAAERMSFTLALENQLPTDGNMFRFGAQAAHIKLVREEFPHPFLGFCYDTGHALIAAGERAAGILEAMGPLLRAVHLQDNAGDRDSHLAPGRGLVDWMKVFRAMAGAGFSGYATIEAPPFGPGPDYGLSSWKELLSRTISLAEESFSRGNGA